MTINYPLPGPSLLIRHICINRAEPPGRGTFGILRSCVITLGLCVYTAVHVNIPRANASKLSKIGTKAAFVAVGMFAPELIVYLAWCQRLQAVRLTDKLNKIFSDQVLLSFRIQVCPFSETATWYA